ncbi:MAG: amidase family protein, partial [Devosia sp.]|nr:amidase family protein [Devosia sp.]
MSQTGPTLDDIGLVLRTGASDPVALTEAALVSAAAGHPALFTVLMPERARAEARRADNRHRAGRRLGPLDGVPTVWKDLFDIEGHPTTAGSRVLSAAPPATRDAAVVEALTAAGMVTLGRVNMSEFAYSGLGLNPHYGTPVNPSSPAGDARIPGGSSSGSAVAVASGLVPVAVGSDTGGSVRIPAAFNGIV